MSRRIAARSVALWTVPFLALASWATWGALRTEPRARAQPAAVEINRVQEAEFTPARDRKRPLAILAIGSDARPGEAVDERLADAIQLITVHPGLEGATILGFPRDSYVSIPGIGQNRINEALHAGGPELVVETVRKLTGIPIDYYMLTSFEGVTTMVNRIDGLEIDIPYAMSDPASGAFFDPGPQVLDGHDTLALARNRKSTPDGDFSRSENQARILLSALERFRDDMGSDPMTLFRWIAIGSGHIITDLDISEKLDLALMALQIKPRDVRNLVVPGTTGMVGEASVVFLSDSAQDIYDDLRKDGLIGDR